MARVNNLSNFLTDVASAIKTKKGSETAIPAANFDTEILALPSQGTYEQRVLNISANGTQTITPSSGYDAIDELALTVAVPEKQLQSKTYNFTQNTNIQLLPDSGYDGFDTVTLNINVPSSQVNNQNKTITQNGAYTADQGYTGIGTATVNVSITDTSEYNSDLLLSQQILGSSALPYIPLEYIESTGTQYIDTGFITNVAKQLTFETFIMWSNDITTRQNIGGDYGQFFGIRNGIYQIGVTDTNIVPSTNKFDEIIAEFNMPNNNGFIDVNDVMYYFTRSTWQAIQLYLFVLNLDYQYDSSYNAICKMRYFKIYENHILVRDFIPVKRKSDNEICLYDRVSGTFFTNAGTGQFVAGPEVN